MDGVVYPAWHGYVHTIEDASILISACRAVQEHESPVTMLAQGCSSSYGEGKPLRMISRRLTSKDRPSIHSGSVFVFEERSSGIHRWTDKLMWSPSRQIGNFFVYRQMNIRVPRGTSVKHVQATHAAALADIALPDAETTFAERPYVGSLTSSPLYPRDGLVKKTLVLGTYHVISYFALDDVQSGALCTPSTSCQFSHVIVDRGLSPFGQTGSSRSMSGPPPLRNRHARSAGGSADSPEEEEETYIPRPIDLQATAKFRSASVPTVHSDLQEMSGTNLATMPAHMRLDIGSLPSHTITGQRGSWSSLSSTPSRSSPLAYSPHILPADVEGGQTYNFGSHPFNGNAGWTNANANASGPSSYSSSYLSPEAIQPSAARPPSYFPSHPSYDPPFAEPIAFPPGQNSHISSLGLYSTSAPTPTLHYIPTYSSNGSAMLPHSSPTSHVPGGNGAWTYEKSSDACFPHTQLHAGSIWVPTAPHHGSLDETQIGFHDHMA